MLFCALSITQFYSCVLYTGFSAKWTSIQELITSFICETLVRNTGNTNISGYDVHTSSTLC